MIPPSLRASVVILVALAGVVLGGALIRPILQAQAPAVSPMYGLGIERLDFSAATLPDGTGQVVYQTRVQARSNFVLVFRDNLLATQNVDYTLTTISGIANVVTFLPKQAPAPGDIVSMIYWR